MNFDHNKGLTTLSVITLSSFYCITYNTSKARVNSWNGISHLGYILCSTMLIVGDNVCMIVIRHFYMIIISIAILKKLSNFQNNIMRFMLNICNSKSLFVTFCKFCRTIYLYKRGKSWRVAKTVEIFSLFSQERENET